MLQQNLPALIRHPDLVKLVDLTKKVDEGVQYRIQPARNGSPALQVSEAGGKAFAYHSRYEPEAEARRQVDCAIDATSKSGAIRVLSAMDAASMPGKPGAISANSANSTNNATSATNATSTDNATSATSATSTDNATSATSATSTDNATSTTGATSAISTTDTTSMTGAIGATSTNNATSVIGATSVTGVTGVTGATPVQAHFIVLGMGLGYVLDDLLARLIGPVIEHQVFVIEPDPQVFFLALSTRDMRTLLANPRIDWCIGNTPDQVGESWYHALDWGALDALTIIEHPPSLARFHVYFERVKEKIRYLCKRSKGNLVTLMHTGHEFHTNAFANIDALARLPGVSRLFGKFRNVPAVIVAAGPSLEKNVHLLSEVSDRFLILATDTTFRPLVARGLRPHIVCAADPSYLNSLDFVGVEQETGVWLAIEPMTHPDIMKSFAGPKMVMTFGSGLGNLLEPFREPIGKVLCWGSIATTAFDMARQFGCDPIIFVGLDLSFQDGRLYVRGSYSDDVFYDSVHPFTSLEHETLAYIAKRGVHRITKSTGEVLFTDQNMNLYRSWFEDQIRQTDRTVVNATEGGIMTRYVTCLSLEETIKKYLNKGTPIAEIISQAMTEPVLCRLDDMCRGLGGIRRELGKHENESRRGRQVCRKLSRSVGETHLVDLDGPAKAQFDDLLGLHDLLSGSQVLFNWFSIHQAKFVTRHGMELKALKSAPNPKTGEWLEELMRFFEAELRFYEYQMPLLDNSIQSLSKPGAGMRSGTAVAMGKR